MATTNDLFDAIKTILLKHATLQSLRNRPPRAIAGDTDQVVDEVSLEAVQDVLPTLLFLSKPESVEDHGDPTYVLATKTMTLAKTLLAEQSFTIAGELALEVALHLVGRDACIPSAGDSGFYNAVYQDLDVSKKILLYECFWTLLTCACRTSSYVQALSWFEELQVIDQHIWTIGHANRIHGWEHHRRINPVCAVMLYEGLTATSILLNSLQNTGTYHYRMEMAARYIRFLPPSGPFIDRKLIPNEEELWQERKDAFRTLNELRHPDPQKWFKHVLVDPRLQVSGAWKRLPVKPNREMGHRASSSAFIWRGYLYIVGGMSWSEREGREPSDPRDVWRLRLEPLGDWEFFSKLPYPRNNLHDQRFSSINIRVYKDKGYLFIGRPTLDILDLRTGKWSKLKTSYRPTSADRAAGIDTEWPWPASNSGVIYTTPAAVQIIQDRLMVFGGVHVKCLLGCNLLMELNLKTLRWRRLSGYTTLQKNNSPNMPGPRSDAASWVDKGRFFIMYGICEKIKPGLVVNSHIGPSEQWTWDDMWSWDLEQEQWRRERIAGNPPAPRLEMGYAYNEKLKKVIIFGGANPTCAHVIKGTNRMLAVAIYADAFILNTTGEPENQVSANSEMNAANTAYGAYNWKQVMTSGFPTYRVGCSLVCDPETGRIYMYGGRVRGEFVPSRNHTEIQAVKAGKYPSPALRSLAERPGGAGALSGLAETSVFRHFGHVWQLHIDIPGGCFESIDKEDEIRTAPPGPWDRCFECGKVDFWKQCGGTCGGKAHFCSRECQVRGWKLHKKMHGCTKS